MQEDYGGHVGKEFYSKIQPQILDYIYKICKSGQQKILEHNNITEIEIKAFFDLLIDTLGEERHFVAQATNSQFYELFGVRKFSNVNPMMDTVVPASGIWVSWYTLFRKQVDEILTNSHIHSEQDEDQPREIVTLTLGQKAVDMMEYDGIHKFYFRHINDASFSDAFALHSPRQGDRAAGYYWIGKTWNDGKLYCYHRAVTESIINDGFEDFKRIIYWNHCLSQDELIRPLASLLWSMSHSSTYPRGQAAITKWLLAGLIKTKGYTLAFSDAWNPDFGNAPPDQQALSELDQEKFIEDCLREGNIILGK